MLFFIHFLTIIYFVIIQAYQPHSFAYAVNNDYYHNNYAHEQKSDDKGYVTGFLLRPFARWSCADLIRRRSQRIPRWRHIRRRSQFYECKKPAYKDPVYEASAAEHKKAEY